jgi:hypothetical protein
MPGTTSRCRASGLRRWWAAASSYSLCS